MRPLKIKDRCTKKKLKKCEEVARTYDKIQTAYAVVAYNPDNCNKVWVREKDGSFVEFSLIENRFSDMSLDAVQDIQRQQKQLVQDTMRDNYQAKIELMSFIETVS